MEIKLFILGLFVATFVKGDRYNEAAKAKNADLEDLIPSEDKASLRFKRQHFRHDPEWHKSHGVDMPHERNDTNISNNGHRHRPFTHNREWHERRGIPMPGDNKNHHHHRHRHGYHHRHPNHRNFSTTIPTTTASPTSCVIDVTASTPTITPIWEIINPRGLIEGINIDFTTSTSTATRPTTTRPTTTRSTTNSPTTTEAYFREIFDVKRQGDQDDTEWINMP